MINVCNGALHFRPRAARVAERGMWRRRQTAFR
jgi:hypothetical protein